MTQTERENKVKKALKLGLHVTAEKEKHFETVKKNQNGAIIFIGGDLVAMDGSVRILVKPPIPIEEWGCK